MLLQETTKLTQIFLGFHIEENQVYILGLRGENTYSFIHRTMEKEIVYMWHSV